MINIGDRFNLIYISPEWAVGEHGLVAEVGYDILPELGGGGGSSHEVTGEVSSYPWGGSGRCGRRKSKTFPEHITFNAYITDYENAKTLQAGHCYRVLGGWGLDLDNTITKTAETGCVKEGDLMVNC